LRNAIGTGKVFDRCHDRLVAVLAGCLRDACVVRSNPNLSCAACTGAFGDVHDHGFAGNIEQGLARQTRGGIAGRNHDYERDCIHARRLRHAQNAKTMSRRGQFITTISTVGCCGMSNLGAVITAGAATWLT
jgi:hypothetical protein